MGGDRGAGDRGQCDRGGRRSEKGRWQHLADASLVSASRKRHSFTSAAAAHYSVVTLRAVRSKSRHTCVPTGAAGMATEEAEQAEAEAEAETV